MLGGHKPLKQNPHILVLVLFVVADLLLVCLLKYHVRHCFYPIIHLSVCKDGVYLAGGGGYCHIWGI